MVSLGVYEQRNAGHLLVGELRRTDTGRGEQVRHWLGRGIDVRLSANMPGAIWSKLLLNCSVTTLGAISGLTMREYLAMPGGLDIFVRAYDEALTVAFAVGVRPERMLVEPVPPGWSGRSVQDHAYEVWLDEIVHAYGNLKPSMLQDFERGRTTEIDFINGYVVDRGSTSGIVTPVNTAIVETVRAITRGEASPHPTLLGETLRRAHTL
jgi:2-dehydropantoate 2-reductase